MEPQAKAQLMDQLFSEIEQGWRHDRDRTLVYRLAEKHPELRGELYEFFEDLVLSDLGDVASETREDEESIARWIHSSGRVTRLSSDSSCPVCHVTIDATSSTSGQDTPKPGDLSLCGDCGALLVFDARLRQVLAPQALIDQMSDKERCKAQWAQEIVRRARDWWKA